jgi:hypothetical protein
LARQVRPAVSVRVPAQAMRKRWVAQVVLWLQAAQPVGRVLTWLERGALGPLGQRVAPPAPEELARTTPCVPMVRKVPQAVQAQPG